MPYALPFVIKTGKKNNPSFDSKINQIEEIRNAPPPEPEVSAEERIAAALEFNNILNM